MLTDCVPSKTLIATAEVMTEVAEAAELGVDFTDHEGDAATVDPGRPGRVNARVKQLAADQSADIEQRLERDGVRIVRGPRPPGRTGSGRRPAADGGEEALRRGRRPDRHRRRAAGAALRA